jgi:hypothetical protein
VTPSTEESPMTITRFRKSLILALRAELTACNYTGSLIVQGCVVETFLRDFKHLPAAHIDNSRLAQANYRIRRLQAAASPYGPIRGQVQV